MAKTLVIAEKPSVARDLAGALPGSFQQAKDKTHLIGDDYVITWAVGHLVGLAEPDAYDEKLKKWRFADLPIVPDKFKLVPNDERAKKQLNAIHRLMARDDVDTIVNACDAGRVRRSTAQCRSAACRRRRWRSSSSVSRRSGASSPSRTGSSRRTSRPMSSAGTPAASWAASGFP